MFLMDNHLNEQQTLLCTYRVNYISGLPQLTKLVRKVFMHLYNNGLLFRGKNFPDLWIPYDSVVDFKLTTGYGSVWSYAGASDGLKEKMINIIYHSANNEKMIIRLEMAVSFSPIVNYRACEELVVFMKQNGIFDKFVPAVTINSSSDIVAQIEKLAELHKSGALTDEEFQRAKSELLKKL